MHRTPWAIALLALSLPAPALSAPLPLPTITNASWNQTWARPWPEDVEAPWPRYSEPGEEFIDPRDPLSWRERAAYALLGRPGYDGRQVPIGGDGYSDGYRPGRPYPLAVRPAPSLVQRRCGPGPALVGAAIGGGLGAALSDGSRQRQWALPIGATVGGLLGGVLAGC